MIDVSGSEISFAGAGMFKSDNEWIHSERIESTFEIIYVLKNEVFIKEEEKEYQLTKGDILLLDENKKHSGYEASPEGAYFYWLHFNTNRPEDLDFKRFSINQTSQKDSIIWLMSQIINVSGLTQFSAETADALCFALLQYLSVANKTVFNRDDKLVSEILAYIRLYETRFLSVAQIAGYFSYNVDYLSQTFKRKTGIGLKDYLNNITVSAAKNMLVSSNYSITEISGILKFSTPQSFISFFKYHERVSPLKYRNANIGLNYNNK